jgi:hypothetical protein
MENTFHRFHANMTSALLEASRVCMIWRRPQEEARINAFQMEKLVKEYDAEQPCQEGSCYEVSVEGAIGYCPGAQYLTRWLFYPAMDEKSISDFVDDLYSRLDEIKAEDEAAAKAEAEAKAAAEAEAAKAAEQPASAPAAKFCPNCGTPYEEDAQFCMKCGTPRQ